MFDATFPLRYASSRPAKVYEEPCCPVEILQADWEFRELLSIYKALKPERVLEIGSLFGGTLWHWMQSQPSRIISIDAMIDPDDWRYERQKESHRMFYSWAADALTWFTMYETTSTDPAVLAEIRNEEPFDFLFIDGDHTYEGAKKDFLNYGSLVRRGGIVVFHDILLSPHWSGIEVHRLWKEIVEAGYKVQELYSNKDQMIGDGTYGIGVVYV